MVPGTCSAGQFPGECFDVVPVFRYIVFSGEGSPRIPPKLPGVPPTAPLSPQKFRAGVEQIFTGRCTIPGELEPLGHSFLTRFPWLLAH